MTTGAPDRGRRTDTHEAIRAATYRALCTHGYTDTTIQHIADEFEKSKSLLYYHYEDKEEILTDFMRHLLDRLTGDLDVDEGDPYADLQALMDCLVPVPMDDEDRQFCRVLFEIRAAAPHDETHRELFVRSDELIRDALADIIVRGIEAGKFVDTDPEEAAEFVHTALLGTMVRGVTLDDPQAVERTRRTLETYLDHYLLVDDAEAAADDR